jgi:hypothetical protein
VPPDQPVQPGDPGDARPRRERAARHPAVDRRPGPARLR